MPYHVVLHGHKMEVVAQQDGFFTGHREVVVGEQFLDFVYYDMQNLSQFMDHRYGLMTQSWNRVSESISRKMDTENMYLRFFSDLFMDTILGDTWNTRAGFALLTQQYAEEFMLLRGYDRFAKVTYKNADRDFVVSLFTLHALSVQQFLRLELEFCMNSMDDRRYRSLTPPQRLYLYDHWCKARGERPSYFMTDAFTAQLTVDIPLDLPPSGTLGELAQIFRHEKPHVAEMFVLPSGYDLMRYELLKLITLDIPLKACAHCARYFIPEGRSDAEYCTRPLPDQPDKTCQSVGAMLKFQRKAKDNLVWQEYNTAYKRANSRQRLEKWTKEQFTAWSKEARQKRDACLAGELAQDDFFAWLNEDRWYRRHR